MRTVAAMFMFRFVACRAIPPWNFVCGGLTIVCAEATPDNAAPPTVNICNACPALPLVVGVELDKSWSHTTTWPPLPSEFVTDTVISSAYMSIGHGARINCLSAAAEVTVSSYVSK